MQNPFKTNQNNLDQQISNALERLDQMDQVEFIRAVRNVREIKAGKDLPTVTLKGVVSLGGYTVFNIFKEIKRGNLISGLADEFYSDDNKFTNQDAFLNILVKDSGQKNKHSLKYKLIETLLHIEAEDHEQAKCIVNATIEVLKSNLEKRVKEKTIDVSDTISTAKSFHSHL